MSSTPEAPDPAGPPIPPRLALPGGLEAGLVGGMVVVAVFLIRDSSLGVPLHTPSVLGTLMLDGLDAAREVRSAPGAAAAYNAVHFAAWVLLGFVGSYLMGLAERGEGSRYLPLVAVACSLLGLLGLDLLIIETGLTRLHLWIGGLAGLFAMGEYLSWRHPGAIDRLRGTR